MLRSRFLSAEHVQAIVQDYRNAGLEPAEVAMLAYAEKVALHAYKVTPDDIKSLRTHGFSDPEILDIAATVGIRCFLSKVFDGVGAEPDTDFLKLESDFRQTLTVGRSFGEGGQAI